MEFPIQKINYILSRIRKETRYDPLNKLSDNLIQKYGLKKKLK